MNRRILSALPNYNSNIHTSCNPLTYQDAISGLLRYLQEGVSPLVNRLDSQQEKYALLVLMSKIVELTEGDRLLQSADVVKSAMRDLLTGRGVPANDIAEVYDLPQKLVDVLIQDVKKVQQQCPPHTT